MVTIPVPALLLLGWYHGWPWKIDVTFSLVAEPVCNRF